MSAPKTASSTIEERNNISLSIAPWPSEVIPDDFRVMTRTFRIEAISPTIKNGSGVNAPERTEPRTVCRISISMSTSIKRSPAKVVVAQPIQKPVTLYIYLTGNTAAYRTANLVARVQGYLESIDYKDGAAVTKGTQLFGIERDTFQAQVDQVKAQLAHDQAVLGEAQIDLNRYQTLQQEKSIASQQPEDQAFVVQQDKATVGIDQ